MTTSRIASVRCLVSVRCILAACGFPLFGSALGCTGDTFPPPTEQAVGAGDGTEDPVAGGGADGVAVDEQDIVGGARDYGHPAVVALVVDGNKLCTGTLVGPRTVLTARHCVAQTVDAIVCPPEGPQVGAQVEPASIRVVRGNDVETGETVAHAAAVFVPPGDAVCEADIAVLTLDQPVQGTRPLRLSDVATRRGDIGVAVGFGRTSNDGGAGKKRARRGVEIVALSDHELWVGEASCHGDSGGPLLDQRGRLLGVLSRGGPGCSGAVQNVYTRPQRFSELIEAALLVPE